MQAEGNTTLFGTGHGADSADGDGRGETEIEIHSLVIADQLKK